MITNTFWKGRKILKGSLNRNWNLLNRHLALSRLSHLLHARNIRVPIIEPVRKRRRKHPVGRGSPESTMDLLEICRSRRPHGHRIIVHDRRTTKCRPPIPTRSVESCTRKERCKLRIRCHQRVELSLIRRVIDRLTATEHITKCISIHVRWQACWTRSKVRHERLIKSGGRLLDRYLWSIGIWEAKLAVDWQPSELIPIHGQCKQGWWLWRCLLGMRRHVGQRDTLWARHASWYIRDSWRYRMGWGRWGIFVRVPISFLVWIVVRRLVSLWYWQITSVSKLCQDVTKGIDSWSTLHSNIAFNTPVSSGWRPSKGKES